MTDYQYASKSKKYAIPVRVENTGEPNGVASLDQNGRLPEDQLPSNAVVLNEGGKIPDEFLPDVIIDPEDVTAAVADWLDDHPEATTTVEDGSITIEKLANDVIDYVDNKIDTSYHPLLTAGLADALTTGDATVDTFAQRTSDRDGACRITSLRGNTVRWNQLITDGNFTDAGNWIKGSSGASLSVTDNIATLTIVDNTITGRPNLRPRNMYQTPIIGHKYLIRLKAMKNSSVNIAPNIMFGNQIVLPTLTENNVWYDLNLIRQLQASTHTDANIYISTLITSFAVGDTLKYQDYNIFDLTAMFGAGNEPATVEEFERQYPEDYYPYDAGSLLSVNVEGIESAGIAREIPAATYFPNGMRSAGSVYDELQSDKAITRIGSRAYQSGDEGNTSVITDGTTTYYALSTPVVVDIDPPLNMSYPTQSGGTESIVIPTGEQSAPPTMAIVYAYNADGVRDLSQAIVATIEGATVSANYAIGGYFVYAGKLYKATSAIATGETITPGTNCVATTVMDEIVRLTA